MSKVSTTNELQRFLKDRFLHEASLRLGPRRPREYTIHINISVPIDTAEELDNFAAALNARAVATKNAGRQNRSTMARVAYYLLALALQEHGSEILSAVFTPEGRSTDSPVAARPSTATLSMEERT